MVKGGVSRRDHAPARGNCLRAGEDAARGGLELWLGWW